MGGVRIACAVKLWRSGIIWSVLNFLGGIGNFAFSALMARRLSKGEFGDSSTTLAFVSFLSMLPMAAGMALVHYIAYFRGKNDDARLQGLLAGCQRFLLQITAAGCLIALLAAKPLASFFGYRPTLMLAALAYVLVNLWSNFGISLCQGMAWFKRLAVVGVAAVGLRYAFGWIVTNKYPTAEAAVSATTFSFLANIGLLYWWKDIFRHGSERISPWTREFMQFLLVTVAYVAGNWFFLFSEELVAKKYFTKEELDAYEFAARWGLALPGTVLPLLLVMFSSRSGGVKGRSDQRILLGLYAAGLSCGAAAIILFRETLVRVISGKANTQAAAMLIPFTIAMTFAGLSQAISLWSLSGRWLKMALLYGGLGVVYWAALLMTGTTPGALLRVMPLGTGAAFCVLLTAWLLASRREAEASPAINA